MLKAIVMAFSFYTMLPMPMIKNPGKSTKYTLSWFPMTGVILGIIQVLAIWMGLKISLPVFVMASLVTVIPMLFTGGIHVDGFMDTTDALRSYKSKEEKIKIMDDPHCGAFSVIVLAIYILVVLSLCYMAAEKMIAADPSTAFRLMIEFAAIFVISRSLSSITCFLFPKAKESGMLYDITDGAWKEEGGKAAIARACFLPVLFLCGAVFIQIYALPVAGSINLAFQAILFIYYKKSCMKQFGGVTGDTAGWFLCKSEAVSLASIAVFTVISIGG